MFPACQTVGNGDRIRCRTADCKRRATFQPSGQGPFLYKARISATRLTPLETGAGAPVGPVTVTLTHGDIDRVDAIAACGAAQATGLVCIER